MDCIITVDIGTANVKVSAFDLGGKLLGRRKGSYPTFHPQPEHSEQDPEQVFLTVLYVLKNLLNDEVRTHRYRVAMVGFTASMHSVLPVSRQGVPLANAAIWADNRAHYEAAELKKSAHGAAIYEATGTPIHPMSPLTKIAWWARHEPRIFAKTYKFISIKEYVLFQLTGSYLIDYGMASATGLFNIHRLEWETQALDFAGIGASQLSEPVSVFHQVTLLKKEYAQMLGLPASTKLMMGGSDGCLATFGAGVIEEGAATITIGSSGAVRVASRQILQDNQQQFFNYLLTEGHYVSGGPTNSGGGAFEWFAQQFGTSLAHLDYEATTNQLLKEAENTPAGAAGLLFLPYILGARAPLWNANARGVYFGVNINHQRRHFARATVEGIVFEVYSIGKLLEKHRTIDSVYVNGAYASQPFWAQLLADVFGKTVSTNDNPDSASLGTALLMLTNIGVHSSLLEAAKTVKSGQTYRPNTVTHSEYKLLFDLFERLSRQLAEPFEAIAAYQEKLAK
ncbi:MAG: gluconokinase [Runella slithyformis]|nr:MAG: gluconokinase [Runella slithyformis]TAF79536.1 MAG: gluconokinase [Runella slithyformis]TAH06376.1 MAG: gluconokinase [Runella slithyformis]